MKRYSSISPTAGRDQSRPVLSDTQMDELLWGGQRRMPAQQDSTQAVEVAVIAPIAPGLRCEDCQTAEKPFMDAKPEFAK